MVGRIVGRESPNVLDIPTVTLHTSTPLAFGTGVVFGLLILSSCERHLQNRTPKRIPVGPAEDESRTARALGLHSKDDLRLTFRLPFSILSHTTATGSQRSPKAAELDADSHPTSQLR